MNFKQWLDKNEDDIDTYNYPDEALELAFNAGIERYKPIVKTVDPESLPHELEVVAIDKDGDLLIGTLYGDSCYSELLENEEIGVDVCGHYIEHDNAKLDNVTKYIEQKDLIKLFGGGE